MSINRLKLLMGVLTNLNIAATYQHINLLVSRSPLGRYEYYQSHGHYGSSESNVGGLGGDRKLVRFGLWVDFSQALPAKNQVDRQLLARTRSPKQPR